MADLLAIKEKLENGQKERMKENNEKLISRTFEAFNFLSNGWLFSGIPQQILDSVKHCLVENKPMDFGSDHYNHLWHKRSVTDEQVENTANQIASEYQLTDDEKDRLDDSLKNILQYKNYKHN